MRNPRAVTVQTEAQGPTVHMCIFCFFIIVLIVVLRVGRWRLNPWAEAACKASQLGFKIRQKRALVRSCVMCVRVPLGVGWLARVRRRCLRRHVLKQPRTSALADSLAGLSFCLRLLRELGRAV